MLGSFVSAQDYSAPYGVSNPQEIEALRKALYAGNETVNPGQVSGDGYALRPQSLEGTMKNLTYEMDEIKLFKTMPKIPATNTVEEFNRLVSYSGAGSRRFNLGFIGEGDLPEEVDSTYERVSMQIKFLAVVGRVTDVMAQVRSTGGNAITLETMNKTMDLLKNLENALFFGDSSLIPEQFDGLQKLITSGAPQNVIDLRGQPLTEEKLNDVLLQIRQQYGMATDGYFETGAFADVAKQVYDRQRFSYAPAPGVLGATITAFQGQHGKINLHDHVFIQSGQPAPATPFGSASKRPLDCSITVAPAAGGSGSQFATADAGTYIYQIMACNRFGWSLVQTSAGVAVTAGQSVTFTVQDGGQGTTFYEVYRSTIGGAASTCRLMVKVARTGATQVITDSNADLPGTSTGFVLMQNQRSFTWAQLLPMSRRPLAAIDLSIRWAQTIYGGVKMYTPQKNIVIKNIARAPGSLPSVTPTN